MTRSGPSTELIERELGMWLRAETEVRAPAGLVEDVFARTSRTGQASRWWPPTTVARRGLRRSTTAGPRPLTPAYRPAWWRSPTAVGGAVALVAISIVIALGSIRPATGPAASPTERPSPSASQPPSVSPSPASVSPSPPVLPAPRPTAVGSFAAQRLSLGVDAGPIDVVEAFDSIWVADIHANDVRRYDPSTMAQVARIPVDSAAWFAVTDDALWVTSQLGQGVSRIDPATNRVVATVGSAAPCAAPVVAFESVWQPACDSNVIMRIDPTTNAVVRSYPLDGNRFLVLSGGRLVTVGSGGLAALDPDTGRLTSIGGGRAAAETDFLFSDGATIWAKNSAGVVRLDPTDGSIRASLPYPDAHGVSFTGDHAWLTVGNTGALEIDLATNAVRRTVPVLGASLIPREAGGALWLTDFDTSVLWRIDLAGR